VPLLITGRWLTWCPRKSRITVAVGRPLVLPRVEHPTDEQVRPRSGLGRRLRPALVGLLAVHGLCSSCGGRSCS
jgi:hypothetical protein